MGIGIHRGRSYSYFASQHILINTARGKINSDNWNPLHECSSGFPPHSYAKSSISRHFGSIDRPDPFARRPTSKCDPYGQDGKPLTLVKARTLLRTVEPEWEIILQEGVNNEVEEEGSNNNSATKDDDAFVPFAIARNFWHDDYMVGAQFLNHVAAVAQINAQHFPHQVNLDRKLQSRTKTWKICTRVVCRTHVLQGLSHHDFYLATLIDIEMQRPEMKKLVV